MHGHQITSALHALCHSARNRIHQIRKACVRAEHGMAASMLPCSVRPHALLPCPCSAMQRTPHARRFTDDCTVPSARMHTQPPSRTMPPLHFQEAMKLVRKLGSSRRVEVAQALAKIAASCDEGHPDSLAAISEAGAIPPLLRLLGPGPSQMTQQKASSSLYILAAYADHNKAEIAASGAIPTLVELLQPGSIPADTQINVVGVLMHLCDGDAGYAVTIAAAGAIPQLVRLLGSGSHTKIQKNAASALGKLVLNTEMNAQNAVAVAAAGAIPALVALLQHGNPTQVRGSAAGAISALAYHAASAATISAEGGVLLLVELLEPGFSATIQQNAAGSLAHLSLHAELASTIADAGAIPSLLRLMGPVSPPQLQLYAARALNHLDEHGQDVPSSVLIIAQQIANA
jgi:hypothetical protein